jgi:hypothetical protein
MNKSWVLIINGFAGGYLLSRTGLGIDTIIAYVVLGITVIWYDNKIDDAR